MTKPLSQIAQTMSGSKSSSFSTEYAGRVACIHQSECNQLAVEIGARAVDITRMAEHHKEGQRKRRAQLAAHPEWMEYPRTRPKALKAGSDFFFSGRMCKNRHYNLRAVLGSRCVACEDQAQNVSPSLATFMKDWIFPK